MENIRKYGNPPYSAAVVHGGPGAAGMMAPVARELAHACGVLEPLQTASSIDGQVAELRDVLQANARLPVTLVGHSWGAWLAIIFAARHPSLVKKLILVGSGPLEEKYVAEIAETRMNRLSGEERLELRSLESALNDPAVADKRGAFARFGKLMEKADSYDVMPDEAEESVEFREDVNRRVWAEAAELRRGGELLELAKRLRCPVIAIQGDYDPHPVAGVEEPLRRAVKDFRFILLSGCGHEPWKERAAREQFYRALKKELA